MADAKYVDYLCVRKDRMKEMSCKKVKELQVFRGDYKVDGRVGLESVLLSVAQLGVFRSVR